jgi:hypothetical protein
MDLMASLEFVQAYMDDLLIIARGILDEHLQKMAMVLTRLRDARLKVNAAKSLFCLHKMKYLGYILTRDGIKPQPEKVQMILTLNLPNNVKELRHSLGLVQYYRDMWERWSVMLAPLTYLVAECRETKTTKKIRPQNTLAEGSNSSTGVWQRKGHYPKIDSPSLSNFFEAL